MLNRCTFVSGRRRALACEKKKNPRCNSHTQLWLCMCALTPIWKKKTGLRIGCLCDAVFEKKKSATKNCDPFIVAVCVLCIQKKTIYIKNIIHWHGSQFKIEKKNYAHTHRQGVTKNHHPDFFFSRKFYINACMQHKSYALFVHRAFDREYIMRDQ